MKIVKIVFCEATINMMEVAGIEPTPPNGMQLYVINSKQTRVAYNYKF